MYFVLYVCLLRYKLYYPVHVLQMVWNAIFGFIAKLLIKLIKINI